MRNAIEPQPPLSLVFDASKLFEWNWGVPQFHKRLHAPISIHLNFRQITAWRLAVRRVNEGGSVCLLKKPAHRPLVRRIPLR